MGNFPGIVGVVIAAANHVDGMFEPANRHPAEIEREVDAAEKQDGDDEGYARAKIGEQDQHEEFDDLTEEIVERRELILRHTILHRSINPHSSNSVSRLSQRPGMGTPPTAS